MKDLNFIQENSHLSKIWTLISSIFVLLLILVGSIFFSTFFLSVLYSIPYLHILINLLIENVSKATILGLFYSHLVGGLFFIPSLDEVLFYYGLSKGHQYLIAFMSAISGYMIAQVINYYLGNKISPLIMHVVSKRKVYKARRFISKHGMWGILLFNFIPFPAPLLSFGLGIVKYNVVRLFTFTLIGLALKYIFLIIIYILFSA